MQPLFAADECEWGLSILLCSYILIANGGTCKVIFSCGFYLARYSQCFLAGCALICCMYV